MGLAEVACQRNDLEGAQTHLETARVLGELGSITENRHRWYLAAAQVAATAGEHAAVDQLLDQADSLYRPGTYPDVRPISALRARLHLMAGDLPAAESWARDRQSPVDAVTFLHEYDELTHVRVQLARQRSRSSVAQSVANDPAVPRRDAVTAGPLRGGRAAGPGRQPAGDRRSPCPDS